MEDLDAEMAMRRRQPGLGRAHVCTVGVVMIKLMTLVLRPRRLRFAPCMAVTFEDSFDND